MHPDDRYRIYAPGDLPQVGDFPVSSSNETDSHNITEILWKVALKPIILILTLYYDISHSNWHTSELHPGEFLHGVSSGAPWGKSNNKYYNFNISDSLRIQYKFLYDWFPDIIVSL